MMRRTAMIEVGQEVMVIGDKGIAYMGYVMATATSPDGQKAYKVAIEGGGLQQLGQWHKACDIFVTDPPTPPRDDEPISINQMKSFLRH
ncbi:MAG TPA: hypothetical protein VK720_06380 [Terracidiphilus sp.]|nr:hypothetical protein [Terracidiphilus sp.]